MGRALLVLNTAADRQRATHWVAKAPWGTRIEFKASKRTLPQNDRMWAMLTDVAQHMKATRGLDYDTDEWKLIFLHGWGREVRFLPSLDGKSVVPVPKSSSDLSKEEMTDFIEYIFKEGADRGVQFHEPAASTPQERGESGEDAVTPAEQVSASSPSYGGI